ncbi:hypothetical protein EBT31_20495, partial [bacterium]|nr:hypothetical protein [bacterium]
MLPAGVNEAIIRTLGMPVDAATAVINAALRGEEAIPTPAGMATRAIRSITGTGPERRVTEAPQIQEPILGS